MLQVYGADVDEDTQRMSPGRCAQLMVLAIANQLSEVWISYNPVLLGAYFAQLFPSFSLRQVLHDEECKPGFTLPRGNPRIFNAAANPGLCLPETRV